MCIAMCIARQRNSEPTPKAMCATRELVLTPTFQIFEAAFDLYQPLQDPTDGR